MLPDNPGLKLATHVRTAPTDAERLDRTAREDDQRTIRWVLENHIPQADGPLLSLRVCMYTNSPDNHFIIDHHPRHDNVTIACGFSGHGFKFASALGETLSELVIDGRTSLPMAFLGLKRFAVKP